MSALCPATASGATTSDRLVAVSSFSMTASVTFDILFCWCITI